jgi:SpoVK/Ycf46/Vps4 family AAA+-type ATPase
VAEVLNRPLYSVSVGELGTDPQELEASLRKILDMASRWNAVLLLDEADIFLEARNEHDIHRNAMVGVFLRLLEYHTGVLFLTTNRVRNFDPAFHSRISLALQYPNLTSDTRAQVIANLSQKARVPIDVDRFKDEPINGRQIKNALRIAQTLAQAENTPFTNDHLARVLELTGQFQRYLEEQQMPTTP